MATRLSAGDRDWVHGDMRGTLAEATTLLQSGEVDHISAHGFKQYGAWVNVSPTYKTKGQFTVHLFTNRNRDERSLYTSDLTKLPDLLRELGHPTGNARWFWNVHFAPVKVADGYCAGGGCMMPVKRAFTFSTVADLIKALSKVPADARVYLASDAEGNDWNPLDYIGTDEAGNGRMTVTLVPMHRGWENYVPEKGGDA